MWRKRPQPRLPGIFPGMGGGRVAGRTENLCTSCKDKKGSEGPGTENGGLYAAPNLSVRTYTNNISGLYTRTY